MKELLAASILVASPCVMKVDRFDIDVRVEGVLVEENRAARIVVM